MRPPGEPLFLARRSYRRRRLIDALRLLPFLGALLFLLPILVTGAGPTRTAAGLFYVFVAWFCLIVLSAMLSRRAARTPDDSAESR